MSFKYQSLSFYGAPDKKALGQGTFGIIKKYDNGIQKFALKKMKYLNESRLDISDTLIREISSMVYLKGHKNVIHAIDLVMNSNHIYIVMPLADCSLRDLIKSKDKYDKKSICQQALNALIYCETKFFVHRDIKSHNFLCFKKSSGIELKLCDFGLAYTLDHKDQEIEYQEIYTLWYRSPEILYHQDYCMKSDIWALGCVFGEIFKGDILFPGDEEDDQIILICKLLGSPQTEGEEYRRLSYDSYFDGYAPVVKNMRKKRESYFKEKFEEPEFNLLKHMLCFDPKNRQFASELTSNEYFKGCDFEDPSPKIKALDVVQKKINMKKKQRISVNFELFDLCRRLNISYYEFVHTLHIFDEFISKFSFNNETYKNILKVVLMTVHTFFDKLPYISFEDYFEDSEIEESDILEYQKTFLKYIGWDMEKTTIYSKIMGMEDELNDKIIKRSLEVALLSFFTDARYEFTGDEIISFCLYSAHKFYKLDHKTNNKDLEIEKYVISDINKLDPFYKKELFEVIKFRF